MQDTGMRHRPKWIYFIVIVLAVSIAPARAANRFAALARRAQETKTRDSRTLDEVARLTRQLKDSDEEKRVNAVFELGAIRSLAAVPALRHALQDPSERVRGGALSAIGKLQATELAAEVGAVLSKDKSVFVKKSAAYALGWLKSGTGTAALITALGDKQAEVRGAAATALGEYTDASAIPALAAALADTSDFVRLQAARALGQYGPAAASAVPALVNLLNTDPENSVKRQSAVALGLIGDRSALPALELAQRSPDPYLSKAALDAIEKMRDLPPQS